MQQYLIIAHDFSDALDRRLSVRPQHLALMQQLKASGNFIAGGAILNDTGQMVGSSVIIRFESQQELTQWLEIEPYMVNKVWERVEVKTFKVAEV